MKTFKTKNGLELPLMDMRGKDYLQVAWRVAWMRDEHADWSIETELLSVNDKEAVAKATIKDANGRIVATSHKTETHKDFPAGHAEKAETGAIGRALALCGYGTQFAPELDEQERIVDAPIQRTITPAWTAEQMKEFALAKWGVDSYKALAIEQQDELKTLSKSKPFRVAMNDLGAK